MKLMSSPTQTFVFPTVSSLRRSMKKLKYVRKAASVLTIQKYISMVFFFVFEYKAWFETNQFQITAYSAPQRSLNTKRSTSCI